MGADCSVVGAGLNFFGFASPKNQSPLKTRRAMLTCASKIRSISPDLQHGVSKRSSRALLKPTKTIRRYPRIALFGDTHFQDRGLGRIVKTGEWIIDEVEKRKVDAVVCLGDVLNTRELVSVRALSAALSFFDAFSERLSGTPIHILLGNHDINLKHSRKFSSLDALSMKTMRNSGLFLHRDLTALNDFLPGVPCLILPYHEDQSEIIEFLEDYASKNGEKSDSLKSTVVFGHLAVSGAQQNHSPYKYRGPLKTSTFAPFKRTFSGHFHHHHELARNRIVYVGSPMQFNFGDAGDTRGIVIYDTDTDTYELIPNPYGEQYIRENEKKLSAKISDLFEDQDLSHLSIGSPSSLATFGDSSHIPENPFKDKFVQIQIESSDLTSDTFERLRDQLLSLGAAGVSKSASSIETLIKGTQQDSKIENSEEIGQDRKIRRFGVVTTDDIEHIVVNFANAVRKAHLESQKSKTSEFFSDAETASTTPITESEAEHSESTVDLESKSKQKSSSKRKKKAKETEKNSEPLPSASRPSGGRRMRQTLVQQQSMHFLEDEALFERLVGLGVKIATNSSVASPKPTESQSVLTSFHARLHSLYIKNFMGVRGELTIPFSLMNSGIWLIEGSNGAGKSTIFEALVWAQFGEFLRSGMQKDYAINDNAATCTVRLIYENGLVIERSRRRGRTESLRSYQLKKDVKDDEEHNEALKADSDASACSGDGKKKTQTEKSSKRASSKRYSTKMAYDEESELGDIRNTQAKLNEKLGVNFETFTKSVVLGQNILHNFVSGNKDMRRAIIEEMLGLEKFNQWLETARRERSKLDESLIALQQRQRALQENLDRINASQDTRTVLLEEKNTQLALLATQREEIEKKCLARIFELESELDASRSELQSPEFLKFSKYTDDSTDTLSEREEEIDFSQEISSIASFESQANDIIRHLEAAIGTEVGEIATCASCGQQVTSEHISSIISRARELASGISDIIPDIDLSNINSKGIDISKSSLKDDTMETNFSKHLDLDAFDNSARGSYNLMTSILEITSDYKKDIENRVQLMARMRKIELSVSRLETSLAQARTMGAEELSEIDKQYIACETELLQLKARRNERFENENFILRELEALHESIESTKTELSMTKFWEMAFDKQSKGTVGTVRAFVFEDVVNELNAICGSYMEQLQTKQQYHLQVSLTADLEMEQVYGKRSGGERKKTDLAILFAMFELVRSQSRYVPDFLMLDEVFDTLDQDGRELVGQVLASLSKRLEKILVITHTDVASGLSVAGVLDVKMPSDAMGNPSGTEIDVNHR